MSAGRIITAATASLVVGGCAVAVLTVAHAGAHAHRGDGAPSATAGATPTARPAFLPAATSAGPTARSATPSSSPAASTRPAAATTAVPSARRAVVAASSSASSAAPRTTAAAPRTTAGRTTATAVPTRAAAPRPTARTSAPTVAARPAVRGQALPLRYSTGNATRVITVVASSSRSTVATLQPWVKVAGGWRKQGSAISARVGSAGIGRASEGSTKTPAGSFTLTRSFGHDANPGSGLPYVHTTPSDYWISTAGPLYNTLQHCASCGYDNGTNEHLYYETPYYDYAVVIDYNTRNAPGGVRPGAGSAFFLHVTVDPSTQGCVSIPQDRLVSIMKWLHSANHPRILIGVA